MPMDDEERDQLLMDTHERVTALHQLIMGYNGTPGLAAVVQDGVARIDVLEKDRARLTGIIAGIGLVWTAITGTLIVWFSRK